MPHLTSFPGSPAMRLRPLCYAVQLALALGLATTSSAGMAAAVIPVAELNGANGFRLDGVAVGDLAGASVSGAGDINDDGVDDLIVAAPRNGINVGSSYVIFGNSLGFASTLQLSSLDGSNGFRLDGVAADDYSGGSVSGAGDINGDGVDDLIIGAPSSFNSVVPGSSYVVFGHSSGFASALELSSLDGSSGFRLDPVPDIEAGHRSGYSVSDAGDINGDGMDDLIIGAASAFNSGFPGSSYVVFGHSSGFASVLALSVLDGSNGFRLDGAAAGDMFGYPVSAAGDVNGDGIDDVIIGALRADPNDMNEAGSSYVVFGKEKAVFSDGFEN